MQSRLGWRHGLNDCNDLPEVADDLIHQPRALIQLERGALRTPNVN